MRITAKEDISLLKLLLNEFGQTSISKAKKMIMYGCVSYKDAVVKSPEFILKKGESVVYEKYSGGKYIKKERCYGVYKRQFYVGEIDSSKIVAKYKDGVLSLVVPKSKEEKSKVINIK